MKIGVFDSGLGGLVITKSLIERLPEYDYFYLGDTKHLPSGEKTSGRILKYTLDSLKYLISQNCKLIIIACNTATSIALRYIQQKFIPEYAPHVKVLGVVIPTVEKAAEDEVSKVGVIATSATIKSHIYQTELKKLSPHIKVQELATPQLVPLIENNNYEYMDNLIEDYLSAFSEIDSLILGCTHYPLIKNYCRHILPQKTKVISQDEFIGEKLQDYLKKHPEIEEKLGKDSSRNFCVTQKSPQSYKVADYLFPNLTIKEVSY